MRALVCFVLATSVTTAAADTQGPAVALGGGVDFTVLGSFDVGKSLGGPAERSDLGPGTLGVFVTADVAIAQSWTVGGEAGIAIGGLVRTDERYFGMRGNIGSTLTAWARARAGFRFAPRTRAGALLGIERMSEASGLGTVRVDAIVVGPWLARTLRGGLYAEVHAQLHLPYRGSIGDSMRGDPTGTFLAAGVRLGYLFGVGQ